MMEYWLLGPLEVLDGDRPLQLGGSKRRALLALLILNANEVVSTDRLAEELWGADLPTNAATTWVNPTATTSTDDPSLLTPLSRHKRRVSRRQRNRVNPNLTAAISLNHRLGRPPRALSNYTA